jgi:ferredoxin-NADP reductase
MASVVPAESRPRPHGQMVPVQVLACLPAAEDAVTLLLAMPGSQRAPAPYQPGQYITLAFPTTQKTFYRSYSLCGDGRADVPWEITIKRRHDGVISNYLFTHARPGMLLQASYPKGNFTLPATIRPGMLMVFIAGGSGITPIYGMLRALARLAPARRPRVWLHYAYHSPAEAIYARELVALDPQREWLTQWHYVATNGRRLRVEQVVASMGPDASQTEWYVCGPAGLKRNLQALAVLRGVPAEHIHAEVFSSPSDRSVGPITGGSVQVRLADSGAVLDARAGETLLETLERHGYRPDFDCRAGACGTCRLRLLGGRVRNGNGDGLTPAERAQGYVLACVAQPVSDVALATAGTPVAASAGGAGAAASRRQVARNALRATLAGAAASLFFTAWGVTSHSPVSHVSNGSFSLPSISLPSFSGGDNNGTNGGGDNGGGFFGQNPNGGGSINTQPGPIAPNTSTGVS